MGSAIQVLVPATSYDLTTLATAKSELGIASADTSQDTKISLYIRQASDAIAAYCNRVFGLETVRETFLQSTFRAIMLRRRPVSEILSVTQGGASVDSSEWLLDEKSGILRRKTVVTPIFASEVVVDYIAGYDLIGDLPYDIERACLLLINRAYSGIGESSGLTDEEIPDVARYSYDNSNVSKEGKSLPPDIAALVDSHKDLCAA